MSRLRICHRTEYVYNRPVTFGTHRLVLRPREGHDLRIESMQLEIEPKHRLVWTRDVFGNSIAIVEFSQAADKLSVVNTVKVSRTTPFPSEEPHEPWRAPYPVIYNPLEIVVAAAYQVLSHPDDVERLGEWTKANLTTSASDAETVVYSVGERIRREITYQRRSEKGVQPPSETLKTGAGSCRDMATLMMDACRSLGIAARFVSGYLNCTASIAGRASTHAWTEVYLPALGWRGFDPTLGEPTSLKHVPMGVSNHPRGVMPISGKFNGSLADYKKMEVQVTTELISPHSVMPPQMIEP